MKKLILLLGLLYIPLVKADATYNYPSPDIINISNGINDYCINLTSGIDLVNCGNDWARNELGFLYTHNSQRYLRWKENFNLSWFIFETSDSVSLVGVDNVNASFGTFRYALNYTLTDNADRIQFQTVIRNTGNTSLNQVWLIFKIGEIRISEDIENDYYSDRELPPNYLNLSQSLNQTFNNPVNNYFQIEDSQNSEGIKLWWDDLNDTDRVNVYSDGNRNKEVLTAVRIGAINPGDTIRRDFWWVDIPLCSGSIFGQTITDQGCVNHKGQSLCVAEVGFTYNQSYSTEWSFEFSPPSGGCYVDFQDNTGGGYVTIPNSPSDPQLYCKSAGKYGQDNICISTYPFTSGTIYTHEIQCNSIGSFQTRGYENFNSLTTTPFTVTCIDTTPPNITFVDPTPDDNYIFGTTPQDVTLNLSANDARRFSAWLDFNHSLLTYYAMDFINSTSVFDNSTYNNPATFQAGMNSSNRLVGKYGLGIDFDGVDDFLLVDRNTEHNFTDFTIEFWIKPKEAALSYIMNYKKNTNQGLILVQAGSGNTFILLQMGNGTSESPTTSFNMTLGEWQHFVATFNNQNISLYKNTVLQDSDNFSGFVLNPSLDIVIGRGAASFNLFPFNGSIDEFKIHNRVLSQEEIEASYNMTASHLAANFNDLGVGDYEYRGCAIDGSGYYNCTNTRNFTIEQIEELQVIKKEPELYPFLVFLIAILVATKKLEREDEIEDG